MKFAKNKIFKYFYLKTFDYCFNFAGKMVIKYQ